MCEPGQLMAIMGASGAGKSTLLDAIAARIKTNAYYTVEGQVMLNGQSATRKAIRSASAYVQQEDALLGTLTPREAISFSSMMRLPASLSSEEKMRRAELLIHELDLSRCADTQCGTVFSVGLSGGEKRRVSIGVELVTNPTLLFLDEPSSGLDSSTALSIGTTLKRMAKQGRTVVCTIHSPSRSVFALFDRVLLMSKGQIAYLGDSSPMLPHLADYGFHCLAKENPADFCLEVLSGQGRQDQSRLARLLSYYRQNPAKPASLPPLPDATPLVRQKPSWFEQFVLLVRRAWLNSVRQPMNTVVRLVENVGLSAFVGLLYLGAGHTQRSLAARVGTIYFLLCVQALLTNVHPVIIFSEERVLFLREKQRKMYRTSAYFLAKVLIDLPFQLVFPVLFGLIPYFMIGFQPVAFKAVRFSIALLALAQASEALGLILGVLVASPRLSLMLSPLLQIPFMLVTGFFLNLKSIPSYLLLLKFISPHKYTFSALMATEFRGLNLTCDEDESWVAPISQTEVMEYCPITKGEQVLSVFALGEDDHYWADIGAIMIIAVICKVLALLALKLISTKAR